MERSEDKTLNLIEMYRERPLLWNSRLTDYKNKNKSHDALLKISVSFRTDKGKIEKKIRYLLSHFAREIKKEKESAKKGTSTSETYQSKWFAHESLLFLKDKNKPTPTLDTEVIEYNNNYYNILILNVFIFLISFIISRADVLC
jgi:hypothetical protein